MRRREFIAGLGGVATSSAIWPLAAHAQQRAMPVIGYLDAGSLDTRREVVDAVHRGLSKTGYVEGMNAAVEYRWAEYRLERLPSLAVDLVRRQVAVIIVLSTPPAIAAKAATKSIPIVFAIGSDPVEIGLVPSLSRPGGNLTGICNLNIAVAAKRLELLHQLLPAAKSIAYLINPADPIVAQAEVREVQLAEQALGVHVLILNASHPSEFEAAFATLVLERAGGLVIGADALFLRDWDQLVALAARYAVPVMYRSRGATEAGGLLSFGTDLPDMWHQVGVYAGRILKGEKPADLPVQQVTKLELAINLKTAKALGLTFPETLLATADQVIE